MDYPNQPQTQMPQQMPSSRRLKWTLIIIAVVVVAALVLWFFMGSRGSLGKVLGVSTTSTYQAVFLTNGQVYFGKLTDDGGNWISLSDIYYLQVTQNLQAATGNENAAPTSTGTANPASNIQLVKLGSELHGPKDTMHIERDKVLFWEDMKDDSKVVAAIHQYQSK